MPLFHPSSQTIGLLGGSFNPAHAGHVHISMEARKNLGIHHIMWMVSPQNPLKSTRGMAPFQQRFQRAKNMTKHYRFIQVSDVEQHINTRYTIDTLRKLKKRFPHVQFIWLMGADNLATIHHWQEWEKIFEMVPVLVLDRSPFSHSALRQKAAIRFARYRKKPSELSTSSLPAWGYSHMRRHPASSTQIRKNLENTDF